MAIIYTLPVIPSLPERSLLLCGGDTGSTGSHQFEHYVFLWRKQRWLTPLAWRTPSQRRLLAVRGCEYKDPDDAGNLEFDWLDVQLSTFRSRNMKVGNILRGIGWSTDFQSRCAQVWISGMFSARCNIININDSRSRSYSAIFWDFLSWMRTFVLDWPWHLTWHLVVC